MGTRPPTRASRVRPDAAVSERRVVRVDEPVAAGGCFRADLDPRIGAWELIRTALGYTLTLPLDIPLYQETNYLPRAVETVLRCLL